MKNEWQATNYKILGYPCVQHKVSKEYALFSKNGMSSPFSTEEITAIIWNQSVAKMHLKKASWPKIKGDEAVLRFPIEDLTYWANILGVSRLASIQLAIANSDPANKFKY